MNVPNPDGAHSAGTTLVHFYAQKHKRFAQISIRDGRRMKLVTSGKEAKFQYGFFTVNAKD